MLNERPEGKDKFGYVLIGLLVAFVIILVTSAVIWNSNHDNARDFAQIG